MRIYALYAMVVFLALYAWRNWFVSFCGLVLLLAVMRHPDFPTKVAGIQGMNPTNILLVAILIPWLIQRSQQGVRWDVPPVAGFIAGAFLLLMIVSWARGAVDLDSLCPGHEASFLGFTSEFLILPLKWIVYGVLMFDGCRTRRNMIMAIATLTIVWTVLALNLIKTVPPHHLLTAEIKDTMRYRARILSSVGYHAVDIAMLLAAAFWAVLSVRTMFRAWWMRLGLAGVCGILGLALALTYGRAGYLAFAGVGVILGLARWRWVLVALPVLLPLVFLASPGLRTRVMTGLGDQDFRGRAVVDEEGATSGRTNVFWPLTLDQIAKAPILGEGRRAFARTEVTWNIAATAGPAVGHLGHPHNMYLEMLLDCGVLGLSISLLFYCGLAWIAVILFRQRDHRLLSALGGMALASVTAFLIAGLGSQHMYPRHSTVGLFCLGGMALRGWTELRRALPAQPTVSLVGGSQPALQ